MRYFRAPFGIWSSILESYSASYLMKLFTYAFLYYTDSQCANKNFTARIPQLVVTKKEKIHLASLHFRHFWLFLIHFVLSTSNSMEPSNILIWILIIILFEVIAFVITGAEHIVISTLLFIYMLICMGLCTLICMQVQSCSNAHYWL